MCVYTVRFVVVDICPACYIRNERSRIIAEQCNLSILTDGNYETHGHDIICTVTSTLHGNRSVTLRGMFAGFAALVPSPVMIITPHHFEVILNILNYFD